MLVGVILELTKCDSCVPPKLMWLLKLTIDQNSIVINNKLNFDFKSYIILRGIQK